MTKASSLTTRFRGWKRLTRTIFTHPSNIGRRWEVVWNVTRFELNALRGKHTELAFGKHSRVLADKGGNSSSRVAFACLPDWPEMVVWQEYLDDEICFFDVGANVGLYSLIGAESGAQVMAFEPAPDMAARVRMHGRLNGFSNIAVIEVALMQRSGTFSLSGPDANRRRAAESAVDGSIAGDVADHYTRGCDRICMKIDVEGNERLVLEGAQNALASGAIELIQIEWNDTCEEALGESRRPIQDLLAGLGYQLFRFDDRSRMAQLDLTEDIPYGRDVLAAKGPAAAWVESLSWSTTVSSSKGATNR